ncbi:phage structural protein [Lysinibacillus sp. TE18511]
MSGHIATYDARKVTTVIGSVILTGFPDGTMVKCSKDNDNFVASSGAQGDVAIAINGDGLGTIEVTLSQTSPQVSYMDKLATTSAMVTAWVNSNNETKEIVGGTKAMVTKPADKEFGKEISSRVYVIKVFDYGVK